MDPVDQIAETRIQEALKRGELSGLPGEGKPLRLDDDSMIPKELRAAYRVLKNAGFLPPELQVRKEIADAEQLLSKVEDARERARARARLEWLRLRLGNGRWRAMQTYYQDLLDRLERNMGD